MVQVSDDELAEWCDQWSQALVVNVFGKKGQLSGIREQDQPRLGEVGGSHDHGPTKGFLRGEF